MKNKSGSRVGRVFRRVINVRSWIDYDRTKAGFNYLKNGFKKLFVPQKKAKVEDFDNVANKMNLSEQDLLSRQKSLWRLSVFMVTVAGLLFFYAGYHLFEGNLRATLLSLVVMSIALVLAFRYHFWYFQIKERKLGCTIQEWFRQGLMGENK